MQPSDAPKFLDGTFIWRERGYQIRPPLPKNILDPDLLDKGPPWLALASALEHAKRGNHRVIGELSKWLQPVTDVGFVQSCLMLIGDAGQHQHMQLLREMMEQSDEYLRIAACHSASHAGYLALGQGILDTWSSVRVKERGQVCLALSTLLDPPGNTEIFDDSVFDEDADYVAFVESRLKDLKAQLRDDDAVVFHGRLTDVRQIAEEILSLTRSDTKPWEQDGVVILRRRFESTTGVDCSSFYKNGDFQPLSAAAIIEDYLASGAAKNFEQGVRYFFGHRVG